MAWLPENASFPAVREIRSAGNPSTRRGNALRPGDRGAHQVHRLSFPTGNRTRRGADEPREAGNAGQSARWTAENPPDGARQGSLKTESRRSSIGPGLLRVRGAGEPRYFCQMGPPVCPGRTGTPSEGTGARCRASREANLHEPQRGAGIKPGVSTPGKGDHPTPKSPEGATEADRIVPASLRDLGIGWRPPTWR